MVELDIEQPGQLVEWLRETGRIGPHEVPEVRTLAGGVSNRTVLVSRPGGQSWVLKQALEQLRVSTPWFCSPERIHREALGMQWLGTLAPPGTIPTLVFEDPKHHLLGMRAVPQPHANWKTLLLDGVIEPDHVRQFGQLLGSIHRRARLAARRLEVVFGDTRYFEKLRLEPFYAYPAETIPAASAFFGNLIAETRATREGLVHGDYSPKNILVHRGQLVLLDHEVIHWGDPMFDVGFALAHFLSKAHRDRVNRQALGGAAILFWEHYQFAACDCLTAPSHQARATRHAIGCLLARAAGKSPVDYLDTVQRNRQRVVCLKLLETAPTEVAVLAERFVRELERHEQET